MLETARVTRVYQHTLEKVYEAFAKKEHFVQWIAPSNDIKTKVLAYDFRINGRYKLTFETPQMGLQTLGGEFVHIQPLQQVCFTWTWEEPDIHAGVISLVTADFAHRDGETELVITHEKLPSQEERNRHKQGWHASLERLTHFLK